MVEKDITAKIDELIKTHKIMLFMKGEKSEPMCGFSAQVVQILDSYNVDYDVVNVLKDWDLREGVKEYSNWPTIPQLYINGSFVGGCDVTMELHRKGELSKILLS